MKWIIITLASFLSMVGLSRAYAGQFSVSGESEFIATGRPSAFKIHGQGNGVTGKIEVVGSKVTGDLNFPLNQFTTGIDLRDKHMKEKYLETLKYPVAHLAISQVKASRSPSSEGFNEKQIPFSGILILHGISHLVNGIIDVSINEGVATGDAQFDLKITDFNIPVPKYLGITVVDKVQVTVHIEAKKLKAG